MAGGGIRWPEESPGQGRNAGAATRGGIRNDPSRAGISRFPPFIGHYFALRTQDENILCAVPRPAYFSLYRPILRHQNNLNVHKEFHTSQSGWAFLGAGCKKRLNIYCS